MELDINTSNQCIFSYSRNWTVRPDLPFPKSLLNYQDYEICNQSVLSKTLWILGGNCNPDHYVPVVTTLPPKMRSLAE